MKLSNQITQSQQSSPLRPSTSGHSNYAQPLSEELNRLKTPSMNSPSAYQIDGRKLLTLINNYAQQETPDSEDVSELINFSQEQLHLIF